MCISLQREDMLITLWQSFMFITLKWKRNVHHIVTKGLCLSHCDVRICSSYCDVRKCLTHCNIKTMLIMVNHVGPCWIMLIMANYGLLWHYHIAMFIRFSSLDCDIQVFSSHDIVRLWSSHCNVGFLFITLWHWNRFFTFREWVMFVTLRLREMVVSLKCWAMWQGCAHHIGKMGYVCHIVKFGNVSHIMSSRYLCHNEMRRQCSLHYTDEVICLTLQQ